jgi:hypothetical protein
LDVAVDVQTQLGHSSLVLHSLGLGHLATAEEGHLIWVWVFLSFDGVKSIQPLVALLEAEIVIIVESSLETLLFAEVVGVETLYFNQTQLLPVVVEKSQHFWCCLFRKSFTHPLL